jgi:multisubunit Na+/H+ antiporter MnhG subunit
MNMNSPVKNGHLLSAIVFLLVTLALLSIFYERLMLDGKPSVIGIAFLILSIITARFSALSFKRYMKKD